MKLVFMGTPEFAVPSLRRLFADGHEVVLVVTQPDRPSGRGMKPTCSPVKEAALELDLAVAQPERVSEPGFVDGLRELSPEAIVVVAFGQKIPPVILDLPPKGCINLHGSVLPEYRGAAPIHRAVMDGREETGVSTMYMDQGWDTGDVILVRKVRILLEDTAGDLHDRLAVVGADLLSETMRLVEEGRAPRMPQDHSRATYAPKLTAADQEVDFARPALEVYNRVRGLSPWPGAFTTRGGTKLGLGRVEIVDPPGNSGVHAAPGTVVSADDARGPVVACGFGAVRLLEVKPESRRMMSGAEYVRGYRLAKGETLGRCRDVLLR